MVQPAVSLRFLSYRRVFSVTRRCRSDVGHWGKPWRERIQVQMLNWTCSGERECHSSRLVFLIPIQIEIVKEIYWRNSLFCCGFMFNMILNLSAFVWIFCTGWLLLPLLVGLWHWSHVGADRTHVCHRLLGDQHYFHHYQYHNGFWLSPDFTYFGEALTVPKDTIFCCFRNCRSRISLSLCL